MSDVFYISYSFILLLLITPVLGCAKLYCINLITLQDELHLRELFGQGNKVDSVRLRSPAVRTHTTSLLAYQSLTVCDLRRHIQ
jgi:hypothetical protein